MKTAISIPDETFRAAERAAKRLKVSRSRFYAQAVADKLKKLRDQEITEQLNRSYAKSPPERDEFVERAARLTLRRS